VKSAVYDCYDLLLSEVGHQGRKSRDVGFMSKTAFLNI